MTSIQTSILELISSLKGPFSFDEVNNYFQKQSLYPNKTTIYRNLEKLEKEGIIKKINLSDQKMFWEVVDKSHDHKHGHLHLVCSNCKNIECKEVEELFDLKIDKFQVGNIEITVNGKCQNCQ
jgi:Fe2+ or Zn2+ uptake regulation protein